MRQESSSKWREVTQSEREVTLPYRHPCVWGGSVSAVHPNKSTICELWWLGPLQLWRGSLPTPPRHISAMLFSGWGMTTSLLLNDSTVCSVVVIKTWNHTFKEQDVTGVRGEGSSSTVMTANQTWIIDFADFLTLIRKTFQLRHINCIDCLRSDDLLLILPASAFDVSLAVFAS